MAAGGKAMSGTGMEQIGDDDGGGAAAGTEAKQIEGGDGE